MDVGIGRPLMGYSGGLFQEGVKSRSEARGERKRSD
jgi:hypothetical protein